MNKKYSITFMYHCVTNKVKNVLYVFKFPYKKQTNQTPPFEISGQLDKNIQKKK